MRLGDVGQLIDAMDDRTDGPRIDLSRKIGHVSRMGAALEVWTCSGPKIREACI